MKRPPGNSGKNQSSRRRQAGSSAAGGPSNARAAAATSETLTVRIIGGSLRGRKLLYSGETRTRPMKDRVREAVFNLLGPNVAGKQVLDLFAGTGALGFEALSRGAARAVFVEQHFPTARLIRQSAAQIGVSERTEVDAANALLWTRQRSLGEEPAWLVFCSPPYALYVERQREMLEAIEALVRSAPDGSMLVVEADERMEPAALPTAERWDVRRYPPAWVAILRK